MWLACVCFRPSDRSTKDVEAITSRLRRVDTLNRLPNNVLQQLAFVGFYEDLERGVMRKFDRWIIIICQSFSCVNSVRESQFRRRAKSPPGGNSDFFRNEFLVSVEKQVHFESISLTETTVNPTLNRQNSH